MDEDNATRWACLIEISEALDINREFLDAMFDRLEDKHGQYLDNITE